MSNVTVDNSANDTDVFVKIFSLDSGRRRAVRYLFIKAGDKFTAGSIRSGNYDVRYQVLDTGQRFRSEASELKEVELADSVRYSNISMTLYKVPNGNMQTYPLDEAEFEGEAEGLPGN